MSVCMCECAWVCASNQSSLWHRSAERWFSAWSLRFWQRPGPALSRPGKCPHWQWLNVADLAGNHTNLDPCCQHCGWQASGMGTTGLGSWGLTPEIFLELIAVEHIYQNPACKHLFGKAKNSCQNITEQSKTSKNTGLCSHLRDVLLEKHC